jgi:hypothetical protein
MPSRFVTLRNCILKSMIDIKCTVQLSDAEIDSIQEITFALEPLKLAVEALCRRDTNLASADAVVKFAVITLEKQSSELARNLTAAVPSRIAERRSDFVGTLLYLNNPDIVCNDHTFNVPKTSTIRNLFQTLLLRQDHAESAAVAMVSTTLSKDSILAPSADDDEDEDRPLARPLSLKEQMEQVVKDLLHTTTCAVHR